MSAYFQGKTVWITGASSGIGEALAYEFAKFQTKLILSARRKDELERVAETCQRLGSETSIYLLDLSNPQQLEEVAQTILNTFGKVDFLVNNGGISQRSLAIETPVSVDRQIMEVDYFSGVILTKALLPAMERQKFGHIIVISSVTGLFGFPLRSAYAAAKHAIVGFYETVRAELHQSGVNVTIVCPGRIRTNISYHALTRDGAAHGVMDHGINEGLSAERCAQKIMKAVKRKKIITYIATKELLLIYFKRYIPWLFYKLVTRVKPT